MNLIDRIKGVLEDLDIEDGQLRIVVNDSKKSSEPDSISIMIFPSRNSPDEFHINPFEEN